MTYHQRIREIQRNLVMGHRDKQTCLAEFEALLHEYGLLPDDEKLDTGISDDNLVGLLKLALNHRDPKSNRDPEVSNDPTVRYLQSLKDINQMLGGGDLMQPGLPLGADLARAIRRRCPVCQEQVPGLFNRMQTADSRVLDIDPPRCEKCMLKWLEKEHGYSLRPNDALASAPEPTITRDVSPVGNFSPDESLFFLDLEEQMKDFKP